MLFKKNVAKKSRRRVRKKRARRMKKWFILRKIALPLIFKIYSRKPIDKKMVIFADYRATDMIDNMRLVYDRLTALGYNTVPLMAPEVPKNRYIKQLINFKFYCRFAKYHALAKYVVVVDYFPPLYANENRPETKVVQLWHACGAFKKWGYSTLDATWGLTRNTAEKYPIHTNYTHVAVSADEVIPHYADAFNMSTDNVFAYGVPRTDVFFDENYVSSAKDKLFDIIDDKRKSSVLEDMAEKFLVTLKKEEPEINEQQKQEKLKEYINSKEQEVVKSLESDKFRDKKVILYVPTFRGNNAKSAFNVNPINIEFMRYFLGDEYCLVYKLHPLVASDSIIDKSDSNFAFDISSDIHINEALSAADVLISDYSSLVFEFALLERPMIFYAYDFDSYYDARGFYYDYNEFLPGPIVKSNYELLDTLQTINKWFDVKKVSDFKEKFMCACDGGATQRIIEKIFMD